VVTRSSALSHLKIITPTLPTIKAHFNLTEKEWPTAGLLYLTGLTKLIYHVVELRSGDTERNVLWVGH